MLLPFKVLVRPGFELVAEAVELKREVPLGFSLFEMSRRVNQTEAHRHRPAQQRQEPILNGTVADAEGRVAFERAAFRRIEIKEVPDRAKVVVQI